MYSSWLRAKSSDSHRYFQKTFGLVDSRMRSLDSNVKNIARRLANHTDGGLGVDEITRIIKVCAVLSKPPRRTNGYSGNPNSVMLAHHINRIRHLRRRYCSLNA